MTLRFKLAAAVLAAFLVAAAGAAAATDSAPEKSVPVNVISRSSAETVDQPALFSADDLLLLEVDVDGLQLSDGMSAYSSRAGLFLPLGELSRLFDLSINVDSAGGRASGWVLSPSRGFRLDLAQRRAQIGDKAIDIAPGQAAVHDGDIYLRVDLLEQLLPMKFNAQLHDLVLTVVPTEKMPFQDRMARDQARARLANGPAAEAVLRVRTPYTLFTPPAVDADVTLGAGNVEAEPLHYAVRVAGDLAYAGFQLFADSDDNARLSDVRVLLERKDPQAQDVGVRGLTSAAVGDTYTPGLLSGAGSADGRGVSISSEPLEQASVFDKLNLRGDLPTGYEVELYVNEILRGSISGSSDGRYEFDDVELSFGLNVIRLRFYGPRGERRDEIRRINVGAGALAKGQFVFALGAVQEGLPVFNVRPEAPSAVPGGTGRMRVVGQLGYGLTPLTTLSAGFADYTPLAGQPRQMASLGLSTSTMGFAVQGTAAADDQRGGALALGLAGRPGGVSVILRNSAYFGGFVDELQPAGLGDGAPLRRDTTVNIDYAAPIWGGYLPVSLRVSEDGFADGGQQLNALVQASRPIGRYLASTSLDYQTFSGPGVNTRTLNGGLGLSGLVGGGWQLHGALAFQSVPQLSLNSVSFTAQRNTSQHTVLQLAVSQSFGPSVTAVPTEVAQTFGPGMATTPSTTNSESYGPGEATTLSAINTWRLRTMDLSISGSYSTQHNDFRVGLEVATGFVFNPLRRRYEAAGPDAAAAGAMMIDAFVDADADGRPGATAQGVPGIAATGGRNPVVTDASGQALVTGLGDGASARVHLDADKLDNPYLVGPPPAIEITPRPGRVVLVPYPFALTSEVEIRALFQRPGEAPRGLSALSLQLVSSSGQVAAEGRTEYDGTVVMEGVRRGDYVLRIEPEQAKRLHLALKTPVAIKAKPGGGFAGQVTAEIVLTQAAESAAPPPSPSVSGAVGE